MQSRCTCFALGLRSSFFSTDFSYYGASMVDLKLLIISLKSPQRCTLDVGRAHRSVQYWRPTETVRDTDQPPCNRKNVRCHRWPRAKASTHI